MRKKNKLLIYNRTRVDTTIDKLLPTDNIDSHSLRFFLGNF